ncbi:hypothetical protein BHE74_00001629 [Ensete ventricosum]|nr:hypothetical protein GW17_00008498 [Ensete ventricosum]RWW89429.1 hypothetical protein BHE74_00001629 [Ensete ventricosum]
MRGVVTTRGDATLTTPPSTRRVLLRSARLSLTWTGQPPSSDATRRSWVSAAQAEAASGIPCGKLSGSGSLAEPGPSLAVQPDHGPGFSMPVTLPFALHVELDDLGDATMTTR